MDSFFPQQSPSTASAAYESLLSSYTTYQSSETLVGGSAGSSSRLLPSSSVNGNLPSISTITATGLQQITDPVLPQQNITQPRFSFLNSKSYLQKNFYNPLIADFAADGACAPRLLLGLLVYTKSVLAASWVSL